MPEREEYTEDIDDEEEDLGYLSLFYDSVKNRLDIDYHSKIKTIYDKTIELLFSPDSFFRSLYQKPVHLTIPSIIILLLCLVHGNYLSYFTSHIFEFSASNPAMLIYLIASGITSTFSAVYTWIFTSLLFTIPLYYYKKTSFAQFTRTLTWVGYGMVPNFILFVVDNIFHLFTRPITQLVYEKYLTNSFTGQANNYSQVLHLICWDPVIIGVQIFHFTIGLLFLLWNAKIWYYGLSHGESLPERESKNIMYFGLGVLIAEKMVFFFIR